MNRYWDIVCIYLEIRLMAGEFSLCSLLYDLFAAPPICLSSKCVIVGYSCCVDETAAQHIAADCIVHFGRSCLTPNSHLPVYYILPKQPLDLVQCVNVINETFRITNEPILLLYDVVYHHLRGKL